MAKVSGRRAQLTLRDQAIISALYYCPLLTTTQISRLGVPRYLSEYIQYCRNRPLNRDLPSRHNDGTSIFRTSATARRRLYELYAKGAVVPVNAYGREPLWELARKAHERFDRTVQPPFRRDYGGYIPDMQKVHRHVSVNDLFVGLYAPLTDISGMLPSWQWRDEEESYDSFTYGGTTLEYNPDAEVFAGGTSFVIEYQTGVSRLFQARIDSIVQACMLKQAVRGIEPADLQLVFVLENMTMAQYARRVGENAGVDVKTLDPLAAVNHIAYSAYLVDCVDESNDRDPEPPSSSGIPF